MRTVDDVAPSRRYAIGLVVAGLVGVLAAATLLVEKVALLEDPDRILTCDINPVISCGSVMSTDQAEAFGFPNPLIGIVGFTVVLTLGVVLLAGAHLPRWVLGGLGLGTAFGVGFVHWLMFQSLYRIGALCPYCMAVWAVTIPLFVATVAMLVRTGTIRIRPPGLARLITDYQGVIVTVWALVVIGLVTRRFWSYWETLL
ncbi:vitamin K epoxide reductase family protein [Iamia majanohamensis]|uniref:Vitamin K epoxide reductase family protein n=1 Tax=Iamia majanohamensis TaxID=467976 RepID=A0AAE9YBC8_9ACTN|nr:vitamin K epoxide reductase family protein [Iamia majanohamensis]WCO67993.1 vitamin K epoxide reductase family protein [Iamia majanohamensis]